MADAILIESGDQKSLDNLSVIVIAFKSWAEALGIGVPREKVNFTQLNFKTDRPKPNLNLFTQRQKNLSPKPESKEEFEDGNVRSSQTDFDHSLAPRAD